MTEKETATKAAMHTLCIAICWALSLTTTVALRSTHLPSSLATGRTHAAASLARGTVDVPTSAARVTVDVPTRTATGTAQTPTRTATGTIQTPTRTATGTAQTPTRTATGTAPTPTRIATGTAQTPTKTATGTAQTPTKTATGTAQTPTRTATGTVRTPTRTATGTVQTLTRTATGIAPTPTRTATVTVQTPTITATGTAQTPTRTATGTAQTPRTATGTAPTPTRTATGTAQTPTRPATGTAQTPTRTATGTAQTPTRTATGTAQTPTRTATGTADAPTRLATTNELTGAARGTADDPTSVATGTAQAPARCATETAQAPEKCATRTAPANLTTGMAHFQASPATETTQALASLAKGTVDAPKSAARGTADALTSAAKRTAHVSISLARDVKPAPSSPVPLPPSPSSPCFRDERIACTCRGSTADCSHNHGRLSYIPAFHRKITTLIFSFNNLISIATASFFHNVTGLVSLNMSHNGLGSIHPEAFKPLTKLQVLDLSSNRLSYSELSAVFAAPNMKELYVRQMQLGPLPRDYFRRTPIVRLMVLDLGGNPIKSLNLSVLAPLQFLTKLKCVNCHVASITSDHLPSLYHLQLQDNVVQDFPDSCRNGQSFFPRLQRLNFEGNPFSDFSTSSGICMPWLKKLDLSKSRISYVKKDMFNGQRFPRLTQLSLAWTQPILALEQYAFRNPTLQTLSLMHCNIAFSDASIHPDCFAGMPRLTGLQLSHNLGSYIPDQKLNRLFAPLTSVEKLYLGVCGINSISSHPFAKLRSLKRLYLYQNKFSEIPDGAFDLHHNLTDLGVNDCQLQTIRSGTFNAATRKRLRHLDFSGNPLLCNCDLLWFKAWFVSSPALFEGSYRGYTCANLNYTLLRSFSLREQVCFFSRETYTFLISSISLFVAALTLVCTCYPYRWHVRLVLYEAFRGREGEAQRRRRRLETGRFVYDVFVSYAHGDLAWVRDHLMPELEGRLGLRLCVHERDFIPGHNIVDNIAESVAASKKVLVLFSRDFAASHWCQFELNLCLRHVIEHSDALVVTCLGDVTSLNVTNAMLAVLKVTTYIRWEDSAAARASFWGRLRLAMGEILPPAQRHV